jgi:hypothetical protein
MPCLVSGEAAVAKLTLDPDSGPDTAWLRQFTDE